MHGFAFGLALDISTCADIRICSKDVKLAVKEVDIGLAADIGTLTRLPRVVGNFSWVKEVALSARVFGAEEAHRVGFVSQVLETKKDAIDAAMKMAGLLASKSPVAVQGMKSSEICHFALILFVVLIFHRYKGVIKSCAGPRNLRQSKIYGSLELSSYSDE